MKRCGVPHVCQRSVSVAPPLRRLVLALPRAVAMCALPVPMANPGDVPWTMKSALGLEQGE